MIVAGNESDHCPLNLNFDALRQRWTIIPYSDLHLNGVTQITGSTTNSMTTICAANLFLYGTVNLTLRSKNYTYSFPNKSGTLALTSDIPARPVEHKLQVSVRGTTYSQGAYFPYVQFVFQYFDDGTEEIPNTWSEVVNKIIKVYGSDLSLYPICGKYQTSMTSPTLPMMVSDLQSNRLGVYYLVSTSSLGGSTISTTTFSIRTTSTSITEII